MTDYDFDYFVIGGGSGGLASAKKAASLGAKVAVADFVKPSPAGTTWGLGGTCVNVGCIPKKLMHTSSLFRETQADMHGLGWESKTSHSWEKMVGEVNGYIKGLNYGAKGELRDAKIKYYNKFAKFAGPNTIELEDKKGAKEQVTAKNILIACGGRPNLGGYPGAEECCISSDDIFWRKNPPGKTLVVGASYIALETAGFVAGFGFDTTVMVRSILLRGFDQDIATKIGDYMEKKGIKFVRQTVPSKFEKTADGKTKVFVDDKEFGVYDTVFIAIGRTGCAGWLNLEAAGVPYDAKTGKVKANEDDSTSVPHIYAVGDVLEGLPELTPVAIQAGRLLANRLYGSKNKRNMDYADIATTVFTPIEYGAVGLTEDDAKKKFGDNMVVYHMLNKPLSWGLNSEREDDYGFFKVICDKSQDEKVVGIHLLGPDAGEVTQGLALAMKAGITKDDFDNCVGIHPTFAEGLTTMYKETTLKKEGEEVSKPKSC
jgi:thioredoxin reductase (NADPH)